MRGLPRSPPDGFEENIPLTESSELDEQQEEFRLRKGKERATALASREEIFRVDDSDDEDARTPRTGA
jgi:carboxypeptidase D